MTWQVSGMSEKTETSDPKGFSQCYLGLGVFGPNGCHDARDEG